ncbi:choice-of-anchor A family protein [Schlesneria sp. T3-172]|uniref:choice-of-anchor A family protein n=1 Tax=Schlesneria TaxID=656899 RepID=UPI002EF8D600
MRRFSKKLPALIGGVMVGFSNLIVSAGVIHQYNVITVKDVNTQNDIEGPSLIGGNANLATVGNNAPPQGGAPLVTVLGNLNGQNLNINSGGSLAIGGTRNANVNYNSDSNGVRGSQINLSSSEVSTLASAIQEIKSVSSGFAQMYADNSLFAQNTLNASNVFQINYVDSDGYAIASIAGSALTAMNANFGINFNVPLASISSLVINVTGAGDIDIGSSIHFNGFQNNSYLTSHLIWNFTDTTKLNAGANMHGAILAPFADVKTGPSMDGSIWANSLKAGGEVHYPLYAGNGPLNPSPVPEPSTLALGSIASVMFSVYSYRRRKNAV